MPRKRVGYLFAGSLAVVSLCSMLANAGSPIRVTSSNRLDHSWKQYRNLQHGFCVSYPSRWDKGDAFEGAGLFVETGAKKFSKPVGEIDVAAETTPNSPGMQNVSLTLIDDFKVHLDGLARFERAERMEVLEQRPLQLAGKPALFSKDRYYDPLERATWIEELVFAHHGNMLYRLELECRADQTARFEPIFTRLVSTFQFDCAAH